MNNHIFVVLKENKRVVHALSIKARSVSTQQDIDIYFLKDVINMLRTASKWRFSNLYRRYLHIYQEIYLILP